LQSSRSRFFAILAAVGTVVSSAAQAASSTFDTGAEGWQLIDVSGEGTYTNVQQGFPQPVVYSATGGNPDGHISATDPSTLTFFFSAPAQFLSAAAMYGGTLKYDIKVEAVGEPYTNDADVVLVSNAGILVYDFGRSPANNPGTSFTARSILWTETGWLVGSINGLPATQQQFQQVTASLTSLLIAGEFTFSTGGSASFETTSLDNVILTPVPEPSEALLMSLGLAGLLLAVRRRKQRVNAARG